METSPSGVDKYLRLAGNGEDPLHLRARLSCVKERWEIYFMCAVAEWLSQDCDLELSYSYDNARHHY